MKIVHLCLYGPVMDGWNYQDNMLPLYHKKLGLEVTVIASQWIWNKENKIEKFEKRDYWLDSGIHMIRIEIANGKNVLSKFKKYIGLNRVLENEKPDIIFLHGAALRDVDIIVDFIKRNPSVKLYVDNHNDFSNTGRNFLSKNILHKLIWRYQYKKLLPIAKKFYGVLPARVDFLVDVYGVNREKTDLLIMGGDDELIDGADISKDAIRLKYGIKETDFLIVTGGKIDKFKTQTFTLMKAVAELKNASIKLLVFGSVSTELKGLMDSYVNNQIQYIGWVNSKDSYPIFAAADLVVFPGRHSVFWEQVVAQGRPILCKYWDGTTHVDLKGNCEFLTEDTVNEMISKINELVSEDGKKTEKYCKMLQVATSEKKNEFRYSAISKKSIELI